MEVGEERDKALALVMQTLRRFPEGERPTFAVDADDTAAAVKALVVERIGPEACTFGRSYGRIPHDTFMTVYLELWANSPLDFEPLISRDTIRRLLETADMHFLSARPKETEEGFRKWVDHYFYGLNVPVMLVNPSPYNGHGTRKLKERWDILWDDAPSVAHAMWDEQLANGRSLLLMDVWDEALAARNPKNTAILPNAEEAGRLSIKAAELLSLKRGFSARSMQRLAT